MRSVGPRVSAAGKKWRDMASLLTDKMIPQKTKKGSVYEGCIRSVIMYGSETMIMTQRDEDIMKKWD